MKPTPRAAAWVPALLVGASAAIAAEVAIGVLLYTGPGMMRSLTTVLAVEGVALAAGLRRGRTFPANEVEGLRRRWLFCLLAFVAAAVFGTSWSVIEDLGGAPTGQGLGLAVLAALPLYACGLVLSGMSALTAPAVGAPAALGAAVGFVITGVLLPRAPIPSSLLVACLVMLSAAGMIFGIVLGAREVVHVLALRASPGGTVRVEDRVPDELGEAARYLLEGDHVRSRIVLEEGRPAPWDVAVARAALRGRERPARVLALGGGASPLARLLGELHPVAALDVLERNQAVVDLARDHLETALDRGEPDRLRVGVGNLEDLLADVRGPYDVVLVDTRALAPLGGVGALSRSARAALFGAAGPDAVVAVGPAPEPERFGAPEGWSLETLRRDGLGTETVLVFTRGRAGAATLAAEGFAASNGARPAP